MISLIHFTKIISELNKNYYKLYFDQKDKMLILNKKLFFSELLG